MSLDAIVKMRLGREQHAIYEVEAAARGLPLTTGCGSALTPPIRFMPSLMPWSANSLHCEQRWAGSETDGNGALLPRTGKAVPCWWKSCC